ncbi:unnamed protein product [Cuscuta europaea]|uniref:ubiquitinyl hydrolase 1 n=1 Tax=Cuscuta europaea TaxID=41803 RepID=A0A9P0YRB2_CUSEU|nr:unnamed protein product [Cuscuta europaea]
MTRILVQRGTSGSSSSSSSNQNRPLSSLASSSSSSSTPVQPQTNSNEPGAEIQDQISLDELPVDGFVNKSVKSEDSSPENSNINLISHEVNIVDNNDFVSDDLLKGLGGLRVVEEEENDGSSSRTASGSSYPPPPPLPPPKPASMNNSISKRYPTGSSSALRTRSRPSSPRSHCESEGYNSADEQSPSFGPSYDDAERERQFEIDLRQVKGLEVKKMMEDGNCLFRAVADQVYGDSEAYDLVRQMCIDYMERERDHFSQFITEGFSSYCKRKRRDKVYGNNVEIQALCEMYNRPIHIYSYSTEPINTFHGSYNTDTPPIRLSYHHRNHYNSLVDPRRLTIGAGLGFSSLQGRSVDKDQIKAAIKAQQDQQIDKTLLAEGCFYSDLELTEKEIERMVMEASRAEYLAKHKLKQQPGHRESSTSGAEPSSSGARSPGSENRQEGGREVSRLPECVLSDSMQIMLSMGFGYSQVIEAYSIFGEDVDSMVCYLVETSSSSSKRRKGKATE